MSFKNLSNLNDDCQFVADSNKMTFFITKLNIFKYSYNGKFQSTAHKLSKIIFYR